MQTIHRYPQYIQYKYSKYSKYSMSRTYSMYSRRKFRSHTSDNMDRWKSRGGKSQRKERRRKKKKKNKKERRRRKKKEEERRSGARKGRKVAKHFVFQNNTAHAMSACGRWGKRIQPPEADVSLENLLYRPSCFFCPLGGSGSDKDMPCF